MSGGGPLLACLALPETPCGRSSCCCFEPEFLTVVPTLLCLLGVFIVRNTLTIGILLSFVCSPTCLPACLPACRVLLRAGPPPAKLPSLDKLLDILVSRLLGAVEALRQMFLAEGRLLPERYSHLKPLRKAQQQQQLMLLMVNDAERYSHHQQQQQRGTGAAGMQGAAAGQQQQQRAGPGGSGLVMSPLGLVNQGGDDRSAAGLAIQHTFGGASLAASKATKRGAGAASSSKAAGKAGAAGTKRAGSGDMGVSAAGRQRKRKAMYSGDSAEWYGVPGTATGGGSSGRDEQQQLPQQQHVLPQHHPHHQIRRGAGGDSSSSLGHPAAAAAVAAAAGAGAELDYGHAQHVQQHPQHRAGDFGGSSESDGTVYCMCLQAHDQDYFISCDRCGDWCHVKCVGMTIAAARAAKSWCCPVCWAVSGDMGALTATSERLAKVRL